MAHGYVGRDALTRTRFVPNPYGGDRLYRTGDVVRWSPDGILEYLGRSDNQVKVRGFRIELEEIEAVLLACEGVRAAAVVLDDRAGKRILACIESEEGDALRERIQESLQERLPSYMIPDRIVIRKQLPRTLSGKVSRAGLVDVFGPVAAAAREPPRTEVQMTIARIVGEPIGRSDLGMTEELIEAGFDSLDAMRAAARLSSTFGLTVPTVLVLESRNVTELEHALERLAEQADDESSAADPAGTDLDSEDGASHGHNLI